MNQLVINPRIRFFGPLATLATDCKHTNLAWPHDRRAHQLFIRHEVAATVAPETAAPLGASTRDKSIPPPSPVYTAARSVKIFKRTIFSELTAHSLADLILHCNLL
jgi:hypothetical protein